MSSEKIRLPPEMVEKYINLFGYKVSKLPNGNLNSCCPICKEGQSWGRKKRLYYFRDKGFFFCFNCNQSWSDLNWIKTVTGKSYSELIKEASQYSYISSNNTTTFFSSNEMMSAKRTQDPDLPTDTIILNSQLQRTYYANNGIVSKAMEFVVSRRLDQAINVPKYGISLTDKIHRNRVIIPFTDLNGKISFYQSRKLLDSDPMPKYLSKRDSEKTVFGIDKVDLDFPYLFITEGPIDSCFIKNGVSLAGLKYTNTQIEQLSDFFAHEKIWVLDNDFRTNEDVMQQYERLIDDGENVFIWPPEFDGVKDINEYCIREKKNSFDVDMIMEHAYRGLRAKQILKGFK
jgi:hypothetical protein